MDASSYHLGIQSGGEEASVDRAADGGEAAEGAVI